MYHTIKIHQIADIDNCKYTFMDMDFAMKHGFNVNDYKEVYSYEDGGSLTIEDALNNAFYIFNMKCPASFKSHSLSVSDIVEVDGVKYYCDDFGWKEVMEG